MPLDFTFWIHLMTLLMKLLVMLLGLIGVKNNDVIIWIVLERLVWSLDDKLSRAGERGDSLSIDLAERNLECEATERYKGFVVRSWLKIVPNEAVKCNAFVREKEIRSSSNPQMSTCYSRIVWCAKPFGSISVIALLACLTTRFQSLTAI